MRSPPPYGLSSSSSLAVDGGHARRETGGPVTNGARALGRPLEPKILAFAHFLPMVIQLAHLGSWTLAKRPPHASPKLLRVASRAFRPKLRILYAAFRLSIEALA